MTTRNTHSLLNLLTDQDVAERDLLHEMVETHVLDMHLDDLQLLVIGHMDRDEVDALLWEPMPVGSSECG